jgi:dimethylhistidine N-methyltransferase
MQIASHDTHRLQITAPGEIHSQFREDVAFGLSQTQKTLHPKYFYDAHGSQLFEDICKQPEYYLTRTEAHILRTNAADIVEQTNGAMLVELGSGSSVKTRFLFDEYQRRDHLMHYVPIDISASMLEEASHSLLNDYPTLSIKALATDYLSGLTALPNTRPRLVLFLGSNLGNFSPAEQAELFQQLATSLHPGDQFLLGLDLRKSVAVLEAAYNDTAGVTAEFNLNILRHINRELGADFNLSQFSHLAFYNQQLHQIEMHLQSQVAQEVTIPDLDLQVSFRVGETIHTEISRKFDAQEVREQLTGYRFQFQAQWTDAQQLFVMYLFRYHGPSTASDT